MAVDTTVQVTLPQMGESVTEGTVLEWHKQEGDRVEADEVLVEVSTDKVDAEVPAPASGTVAKIHAAEGDTVQVGGVLAEIATGNGAAPSDGAQARAEPEAPPSEGNGAPPAEREAAPGQTIDIVTPTAGESVSEGTLVEWHVAAGDAVEDGQAIAEISTDKIDVELPAPAAGTITEVLVDEGSTVTVGQVIARMTTATDGASATAPGAEPRPLRGGAGMLARYMDESRSIPTATSFRTITVTTMDGRRKQLKDAGQRVSFTHLIAYAVALAAQNDAPVMAHHFLDIDGKPHRVENGRVNLGIAVDVEKKDGSRTLMVPVIRDAGRMSFRDFKAAFDALIEKARTNTLSADDLTGSNISLTNPGGLGTVASVPRLMVGQGTIVATG